MKLFIFSLQLAKDIPLGQEFVFEVLATNQEQAVQILKEDESFLRMVQRKAQTEKDEKQLALGLNNPKVIDQARVVTWQIIRDGIPC
jgi:hypothetical protein